MMGVGIAQIEKIIFTDDWEMYFENPIQDYLNIKKEKIRLIISKKKLGFLRHVPDNYTPKGFIGYGLIRGYNCQGRCHYCYLQSYFKSPDMVKFFNIEEYLKFLEKFLNNFFKKYLKKKIILYDGDFQDSLGFVYLKKNLEFLERILQLISKREDNVKLEIRTKQIVENVMMLDDEKTTVLNDEKKRIFKLEYLFDPIYGEFFKKEYRNNLIVAITFSPKKIIDKYERGTSSLDTRLRFAKYIQKKGFNVGIRIDPIILDNKIDMFESLNLYLDLIKKLTRELNINLIEDRSIGLLRLKNSLYKKYKNTDLVNNLTDYEKGFYRYPKKVRKTFYEILLKNIRGKVYICMDDLFV